MGWSAVALLFLAVPGRLVADDAIVRVGSKSFTESVILGEIGVALLRDAGIQSEHVAQLGGTRVLTSALQRGEIDVYPEYTGTIAVEILGERSPHPSPLPHAMRERGQQNGLQDGGKDLEALRTALAPLGLELSQPLGFDNTYALGMKQGMAGRLRIWRISELRAHPALVFGFTNEFMDRADGWPGLRDRYLLPQADVRGLDHDLAYRGLAADTIHVTDLYSTDADIQAYRLRVLEDDLHYFPKYQAVWLMRSDLAARVPAAPQALAGIEGKISAAEMIEMNARARLEHAPESIVAADFLATEGHDRTEVRVAGRGERIRQRTLEHLTLVLVSLLAAIVVAIPLGIVAALRPRLGRVILTLVGVVQTIPSLALLVVLIPILGIGTVPALVALFLYGLLPIVRNTYTGLHDIPLPLRESAEALGLSRWARLWTIELPLAAAAILAGIKTSAVINVGTATLGALVGAGGYGQPILTGIRLDDVGLILEGAIPAALLALAVEAMFEAVDRIIVPRGLRQPRETR